MTKQSWVDSLILILSGINWFLGCNLQTTNTRLPLKGSKDEDFT